MRKAFAIALALSMSTGAWAAGGNGGGGGSGGNGGGSTVTTCKSGYVYDKSKKKCVKKGSSLVPKEDILQQAWVLAKSGHFEDGRDLFTLVNQQDPANPEALNGMGYTNRKLGNYDVAFVYYNKALTIDPNYLDAREYLGEGYAVIGRLDLAKAQLDEIGKRGGTQTEQYTELSEAIADAVKSATTQ